MRIVKEHIIFERFTEESDPIHDLGIGMKFLIEKWMRSMNYTYDSNNNHKLIMCSHRGKTNFVKYLLSIGANVHESDDLALRTAFFNKHANVVKLLLDAGADIHIYDDLILKQMEFGYDNSEIIKIIRDHLDKEKLKESLNEKFTEDDSDPVHDLGIGVSKIIEEFPEKLEKKVVYNKNTEYQMMDTKHWQNNYDKKIIRSLYVKENKLTVGFYCNKFRIKDSKQLIDKIKYAKIALKFSDILSFLDKEEEIRVTGSSNIGNVNKYTCDEVVFTIKDQFVKFFKHAIITY